MAPGTPRACRASRPFRGVARQNVEISGLAWLIGEAGGIVAATAGVLWAFYTRCSVRVPPNRALVLYGRRAPHPASDSPLIPSDVTLRRAKIVVGGRALVAPWDRGVGYLSLAPIAVDVTVRSMHSLEGTRASGWEVRVQAQAKVPAEPGFLSVATENLLGKTDEEIRSLIARTVEGAAPAVLARIKSEDGEPDWDRLAAEIQACAAPDLVSMGLAIRTLTVTELHRILPPAPSAVAVPVRSGVDGERIVQALGVRLSGLDARLARTERGLSILGEEVLRPARRPKPETDALGPASVFDRPLGSDGGFVETANSVGFLHDPSGDEYSSRPRTSPAGDPARERSSGSWPPLE